MMEPKNNDISGLPQISVGLMNREEGWETTSPETGRAHDHGREDRPYSGRRPFTDRDASAGENRSGTGKEATGQYGI